MIKIQLPPMSDELRARYEEMVRLPGQKWLAAYTTPPKKRLPSYWREVQPDLAEAYQKRCAYTATWINYGGQVDHAISIDEDVSRAYDWDNFRYCAGWFNSRKRNARSHEILDPLNVEDGWFELSLPDLQLHVTEQCPDHLRARAEFMLENLGLRNSEQALHDRESYWEQYLEHGEAALPFIELYAPLLARAIRTKNGEAIRAALSAQHAPIKSKA